MKSAKRGKDGQAAATAKRTASKRVSRKTAAWRRTPAAPVPARQARPRLLIPPLLLEKEPASPVAEVSPAAAGQAAAPSVTAPPQLKLTPRDPHWLHAHWEFSPAALREVSQRSAAGHMTLRLFEHTPAGRLVSETRVRPEAARWFVHVETPGTAYAGQLGYYDPAQNWVPLVASPPVRTPPNGPSGGAGFELATLEADGTLARHGTTHTLVPPWSPEREATLQALARGTPPQSAGDDSLTLSQPPRSFTEPAPGPAEVSSWGEAPSGLMSSPMGAAPGPAAGFRLEVNAELIVYGATEPDAVLTIGDRPVALAPDGSFRFRFALPDGSYALLVRAEAADRHEARQATLRFSRDTELHGAVGEQPPEPGLQPPPPGHG